MVEDMKVREGYKRTEVGVIPEDWEVQDLGRSSTLKARIGWQGLTTSEYLDSGEYFLVTGTDFKDGRINWTGCHYVEKERYNQDINIQLQEGDVLVTKDGTIGKIAYVDQIIKDATLNSGVFVIRPLRNAYYEPYLYHIFMSNVFKDFLNKLTAGSTIIHLYQKDFINFKFPSPNIEEQKLIAKVLTDTDNLIHSIQNLIDKKEKIKKVTMQELLIGKKRLDGFSGEWEIKKLEDICDVKGGKRVPKGNDLTDKNTGYPYIRVADMYDGGVTLDEIKYITPDISEQIKNYRISKDDLFISVAGTLGLVGCIPKELNNANLTENANKLCNLKCNKIFLMYVLLSENIQNIISQIRTVGAQPKLALGRIQSFEIYIPQDINEQKAISKILSDMDKEIETLKEKLEKYKKVKKGMMQELLTGRIRLI